MLNSALKKKEEFHNWFSSKTELSARLVAKVNSSLNAYCWTSNPPVFTDLPLSLVTRNLIPTRQRHYHGLGIVFSWITRCTVL